MSVGETCVVLRRTAIWLIAIGVSAMASIGGASALDYPTRPVHWVVGFAPGGSNDIIARLIGQRLSERLGQQFLIENKPGAGGNIATESVINAKPDGYTVLLVNPANYINTSLYSKQLGQKEKTRGPRTSPVACDCPIWIKFFSKSDISRAASSIERVRRSTSRCMANNVSAHLV
jgi:tripartite-type tricarboxylate transporter receptor subunit TctC